MHRSAFEYPLPESRIAQKPIEPRDASRLLAVSGFEDHQFHELPALLDEGDLVVVNDTRVRHCRLIGTKSGTGGRVEALVLGTLADGSWEALIKPARRIPDGTHVEFGELSAIVETVGAEGRARLRFDADPADLEAMFERVGQVPLPPYIGTPTTTPGRYQTIYARRVGSAAAPTAGLHITSRTLEAFAYRSIDIAEVDLEVGLGTFRPITTDEIEHHTMHTERFSVPASTADAIAGTRGRGGRVVAIGTTVVRTLESVSIGGGLVEARSGSTDLYLMPGQSIDVVDRLVTNFHLPGSSLLVLLEAFMGPGWRLAYETALSRGYRFLSFGDAMLCDRQ